MCFQIPVYEKILTWLKFVRAQHQPLPIARHSMLSPFLSIQFQAFWPAHSLKGLNSMFEFFLRCAAQSYTSSISSYSSTFCSGTSLASRSPLQFIDAMVAPKVSVRVIFLWNCLFMNSTSISVSQNSCRIVTIPTMFQDITLCFPTWQSYTQFEMKVPQGN